MEYVNEISRESMDKRMVRAEVNRVLQQLKTEEETDKYNEYKISQDELHNAIVAHEVSLARGIELIKREKRIEEARRQQIRENNPELRELEQKLRAAYINRDVMQQIRENEYRKRQQLVEEQRRSKIILEATYNDDDCNKILEENEKLKKLSYRKDLQEQMIIKAKQKLSTYENNIIEREKNNEVLRIINDENHREIELKKIKKEKIKHEMETFQMAKNAWKEKQRLLILQEEQNIENYEKKNRDKVVDRKKDLKDKFERQQERMQRIAKQISSEKAQKEEREYMLITLNEQEVLDLNIQRENQEQGLMEARKEETKIGLLKQISEHQAKKMQDKEEDKHFRFETQYKADLLLKNEIEKENNLKERNLQYGKEIKQQILLNKEKRECARKDEEQRNAGVLTHCDMKISDVMAERTVMIKEYAPNALGFLQQGLLTNEDLETVREGCANDPAFTNVDIEAMYNRIPKKNRCNPQCMKIKKY